MNLLLRYEVNINEMYLLEKSFILKKYINKYVLFKHHLKI